jgi:hypothetical protein
MLATQNMVQTLLGTDNITNGKKVETTIHHAMQPQLSVRVSRIESFNEETEIKLQFECLLQLVPVASCSELKRGATQGCVLWGPLTECDWQNGCCMWRMRAAVDLSDRGE